jgi:hypothetical protein
MKDYPSMNFEQSYEKSITFDDHDLGLYFPSNEHVEVNFKLIKSDLLANPILFNATIYR